jgi:hypothetical protein
MDIDGPESMDTNEASLMDIDELSLKGTDDASLMDFSRRSSTSVRVLQVAWIGRPSSKRRDPNEYFIDDETRCIPGIERELLVNRTKLNELELQKQERIREEEEARREI